MKIKMSLKIICMFILIFIYTPVFAQGKSKSSVEHKRGKTVITSETTSELLYKYIEKNKPSKIYDKSDRVLIDFLNSKKNWEIL